MVIEAMLWGMHRPGTTDLVINGRFEELINKPMFRGLLNTKRCVVSLIISLPMLKSLDLSLSIVFAPNWSQSKEQETNLFYRW